MTISEITLNNKQVKSLIPRNDIDVSSIKGGDFLSDPYNLSLICSKRKSGKSTVIGNVVLATTAKKTVFFIFSPNAKTDNTMITLIEKLKKRGNIVMVYPSLMDGKEDILQTIIDALLDEDDEEGEVAEKKMPDRYKRPELGDVSIKKSGMPLPPPIPEKGEEAEIPKVKVTKYKPKKISPDYCVIIDDLATQLNKTRGGLANLCFNGRHLKMSIYISFQYKNQLPPALWAQSSYIFLFKNLSEQKLKEIYEAVDLHGLSFEQFMEVYRYTTKDDEKRDFLLCDVNNSIYRKNFSKKLEYNI